MTSSLAQIGLNTVPRFHYALGEKYRAYWEAKGYLLEANFPHFHPLMCSQKAFENFNPDSLSAFSKAESFTRLDLETWFSDCFLSFSTEKKLDNELSHLKFQLNNSLVLLKFADPVFFNEILSNILYLRAFSDTKSQWESLCLLQMNSDFGAVKNDENLPSFFASAGSFSKALGFVVISENIFDNTLKLAMQITHEATHQLIFVLESNKNYLTSKKNVMVYSPSRKAMRPICAALHGAFAITKELQFLKAVIDKLDSNSQTTYLPSSSLEECKELYLDKISHLELSIRGLADAKGLGPDLLFSASSAILLGKI